MKKLLLSIFVLLHLAAFSQYNKEVPLYTIPYKTDMAAKLVMDFHPNGKTLVYGSSDGLINLYDCSSGTAGFSVKGHDNPITFITFSRDGKIMISGDNSGQIKFWTTDNWKEKEKFSAHSKAIVGISLSPDNESVLTAGKDGFVKIWEIKSASNIKTLDKISGNITDAKFSPDGKYVIVAIGSGFLGTGSFKGIKFFDSKTGGEMKRLDSDETEWFIISQDESTMATANKKNEVAIWDAKTGQKKDELFGHTKKVNCLAFSPASKIIASGSDDKTVQLWDWKTRTSLYSLIDHKGEINGIVFSSKNNYLATSSLDNTIKIWDLKKLKLPQEQIYESLSNRDLQGTDFETVNNARNALVYEKGKSAVPKSAQTALNTLATFLIKNKNYNLVIYAHTDNSGEASDNWKISNDRAGAVKLYLVNKKVGTARITALGFGGTMPIQSNSTDQGKAANNRVELFLVKK